MIFTMITIFFTPVSKDKYFYNFSKSSNNHNNNKNTKKVKIKDKTNAEAKHIFKSMTFKKTKTFITTTKLTGDVSPERWPQTIHQDNFFGET